jgi:hypothetical protein
MQVVSASTPKHRNGGQRERRCLPSTLRLSLKKNHSHGDEERKKCRVLERYESRMPELLPVVLGSCKQEPYANMDFSYSVSGDNRDNRPKHSL